MQTSDETISFLMGTISAIVVFLMVYFLFWLSRSLDYHEKDRIRVEYSSSNSENVESFITNVVQRQIKGEIANGYRLVSSDITHIGSMAEVTFEKKVSNGR